MCHDTNDQILMCWMLQQFFFSCSFGIGTCQECQYYLMCHGIEVNSLPVDDTLQVDTTYHLQWLEERRRIEESRRAR